MCTLVARKPHHPTMSSGKPSPSGAPVDNITTTAAAESTKRLRDDADFAAGIDEDDSARQPPPKRSLTTGAGSSAAASGMTLPHTLPTNKNPTTVELVEVRFNGSLVTTVRVNESVENAVERVRLKLQQEGWLENCYGLVLLPHEKISVDDAPYLFLSRRLRQEGMDPLQMEHRCPGNPK